MTPSLKTETTEAQERAGLVLGALPGSTLTLEELGKLSTDLDAYMDWAQVWHKQSGGYTASDTFLTIMRIEKWARRLSDITGKPQTPLREIEDAEDANPSRSNV
jgi:hypothetical protein